MEKIWQLYWVVYLIIHAVIFATVMYPLRKFFEKIKFSDGKNRKTDEFDVSRVNSRSSLVSRGKQ